jgi:hypothetical protein
LDDGNRTVKRRAEAASREVGITGDSPCARFVGVFGRLEGMQVRCMLWFESWLLSQLLSI